MWEELSLRFQIQLAMQKQHQAQPHFSSRSSPDEFTFSQNLDQAHLLMIYEDDLERASAIFGIFLDGIGKEMNGLEEQLAAGDTTEFVRKVHKMAPNFAMVGLTEATEELFAIEKEGKTAGLSAKTRQLFSTFGTRLDARLALVRDELARIKNYLNK